MISLRQEIVDVELVYKDMKDIIHRSQVRLISSKISFFLFFLSLSIFF